MLATIVEYLVSVDGKAVARGGGIARLQIQYQRAVALAFNGLGFLSAGVLYCAPV